MRKEARPISWSILPEDLLVTFLQAYAELEGIHAAAKTRQVSKAWAAAFSKISAGVVYTEENHLPTLGKILPRTASLKYKVSDAHSPLYQRALACFSELTTLQLDKSEMHYPADLEAQNLPKLDLGCLPRGLKYLKLNGISVRPGSEMLLQCTDLKQFYCESGRAESSIRKLLPHLTSLKELGLGNAYELSSEDYTNIWERMPNLTHLQLSKPIWKVYLIQERSMPKLRKLVLSELDFEEGALNQYLQAFTHLTELDLCFGDRQPQGPHLSLPPSLRVFTLLFAGCLDFDWLPLVSFHWADSCAAGSMQLKSLQVLATLTTLTSLKLSNVGYESGGEVLQALYQLQEITLIDCTHMELDLFSLGAFPQLRALCLDGFNGLSLPYYSGTDERKVAEAQEAILGISTLRELSGWPEILEAYFEEGQQQWKIEGDEHFVVCHKV